MTDILPPWRLGREHHGISAYRDGMTAALSEIYPPPGGWTTDVLDALPEDGRRRELLDGVLIVSPSPTKLHQDIVWRLAAALDESCPGEYSVTQGVEVRISRHRSFIPDVLVTIDTVAQQEAPRFEPHEVLLAVEVVSESSRTLDRFAKPALYAQAGIPFYWRIETEDKLVVHTYRTDPIDEIYVETGRWTKSIDIDEPWPIKLPISRLTQRGRPAAG